MSDQVGLPKLKMTGFALVRDKNGRPKLSEHMQKNPHDIPQEIRDMMTTEEKRWIGLDD